MLDGTNVSPSATSITPAALNLICPLKAGTLDIIGAKKPRVVSTSDREGVASKVAVKPLVPGVAGRLMRWMPDPARGFTQPAETIALATSTTALAVAAVPSTDAVTEMFCETLLLLSVPVTVIVAVLVGAEVEVWTVRLVEPEPPVIVVLSRLATTPLALVVALSVTVPLNPFTGCTLMLKLAVVPAVTFWVVGLAVNENSELLPVPVPPPTTRRGDITHPLATNSRAVNKNVSLRMRYSSFPTLLIGLRTY